MDFYIWFGLLILMIKSLAVRLLQNLFRNKLTRYLTANQLAQQGIRQLVEELDYTRGIGAGAGVETSGERILTKLLSELDGTKTVFDVGANEGEFTELIDSDVKKVQIHLFEPQQKLCQQLKTTYSKHQNKKVNCFALSDEAKQTILYYDQEGSGLASMSKRKLDHHDIEFDHQEDIETQTVEEYCDKVSISKIDLLKIDVEGHELDVLAGAKNMISQQNIRIISFEFGGANIDTRTFFQDYYYLFEENGYYIYRILPNGSLHKINQYSEIDERFQVTNYIATANKI